MSTIAVTNLKHESASGNNITLDSSGSVGVGTASPSYKLQVDTTSSNGEVLGVRSTGGTLARIAFGNTGVTFGNTQVIGNGNALTFVTNADERMRIDNSGRVTMPYQPRFMAYTTAGGTNSTAGDFPFNSTAVNTGSHFSTSTYKFTAPVAGTYRFTVGSLLNNGAVILIQKNGSSYIDSDTCGIHQSGATYVMCFREVIMTLAANDYVAAYLNAGSVYNKWTVFTGELIG